MFWKMLMAILLLTVAIVGVWLVMSTPGCKPLVVDVYDEPNLMVETRQVQFGDQVMQRLPVYNTGGKTLYLQNVVSSCASVDVLFSGNEIKSGEHKWIELYHRNELTSEDAGCTITIFSNDPDAPRVLLSVRSTPSA